MNINKYLLKINKKILTFKKNSDILQSTGVNSSPRLQSTGLRETGTYPGVSIDG